MPIDDLQQKIAQARLAMGGDKRHVSPDLLVNALVNKRRSTLNLSEADLKTNHGAVLPPAELEKRKSEARIAMESAEYKKRREAKEKADKEAKIMAQKVLELKQARLELEKKRGLDSKSKMVYDEEKRLREEELYQKRLQTSKELIAELTQDSNKTAESYHTLTTDLNAQIGSGKLTMAKIAMEEEARRRLATMPTKKPLAVKNILIGIAMISFLILGSLALYFSLQLTKPSTSTVRPLEIASLIFANQNQELILDNKTASDLSTELKTKISTGSLSKGTIVNIYPTKKIIVEGQELKTLATGKDTLTALGLNLPANFTHFLLDKFMVGSVGGKLGVNQPFLILKTRSFPNTLDTLLRNEATIIGTLINPLVSEQVYMNSSFTDKVIANIDTRVWTDVVTGKTIIYGFFDQETLVITTDTDSFSDLLLAFQSR
jgi:hypothetical protein